jgi:hypothetical protein
MTTNLNQHMKMMDVTCDTNDLIQKVDVTHD